jgi:hypothetical protein
VGDVSVLKQYEEDRRVANAVMLTAVDGLKRVWGTSFLPLAALRNLGLKLTDNFSPLKVTPPTYNLPQCRRTDLKPLYPRTEGDDEVRRGLLRLVSDRGRWDGTRTHQGVEPPRGPVVTSYTPGRWL